MVAVRCAVMDLADLAVLLSCLCRGLCAVHKKPALLHPGGGSGGVYALAMMRAGGVAELAFQAPRGFLISAFFSGFPQITEIDTVFSEPLRGVACRSDSGQRFGSSRGEMSGWTIVGRSQRGREGRLPSPRLRPPADHC